MMMVVRKYVVHGHGRSATCSAVPSPPPLCCELFKDLTVCRLKMI